MLLWLFYLIFTAFPEVTIPGGVSGTPQTNLRGYDLYPIPENENCSELSPGQSIILNDDFGENSPALRRYKLTRLQGKNQYRIDLNLNFVPTDELQTPRLAERPNLPNDLNGEPETTVRGALDDESRARMLGRVNQCLRQNAGQIRSPNGTQLQIYVQSNPQSDIPQHKINISNTSRANVADWSSSISCATIIHELMHTMGLADAYPEKARLWDFGGWSRGVGALFSSGTHQRRYTEVFPCRVIEPETSIMNNSARSLEDSSNALICRFIKTARSRAPSQVTRVAELPSQCPRGSRKERFNWVSKQGLRTMYLRPEHANGYQIYHVPVPRTGFALQNAQTRFITQPRCVSANRKYLTCTQDTYEEKVRKCHRLPPYCSDGTYLQ